MRPIANRVDEPRQGKLNMSKSILVTGGFGFIGSHLVELLLADGKKQVHVVDDLSTSPICVEKFVRQLRAGFSYDICAVEEYFRRPDRPRFDEVYHLAAVVGPVGVLKHSGEILRRTVNDTYAVSDYALRVGARLCDISTSEVYGGGRNGYCSESDSMIISPRPSVRLEYSVAKLAAEVALVNQTVSAKLHATIIRPFNVAGPRQATSGGFVLPRFIRQAMSGEPLTVYGDGSMIRAFTYVGDIADGIVRSMERGTSGRIYNLGNPKNKTSILELARHVQRIVNPKAEITFVDPKQLWGPLFEEANDKYPDSDRAVQELEWAPQFGLEETIYKAAEYIRLGRCD